MLSRRSLLVSSALPLAASLTGPAAARAPQAGLPTLHPAFRTTIGRLEVTFLSDGYIDLPFGIFTGAPAAAVGQATAAVHAAGSPGTVRAGFTVWLVRQGDRLILVDTGAAGSVSPTSGRLVPALAALGVTPEMIDAVIVTHMHVDHVGGLVAGGRRVFPNAELYVDRRDVAFFTDAARAAAAPEILKSSFAAAAEVVRLYPALQRFDGEREIAPGIGTVDLAGHTPGHTGIRLSDGGETLLLAGDTLFHPAAHPGNPGIGIAFEPDAAAAAAMRTRFFARAEEEKALVAATHMPFPGLGRVVRENGVRRWLPADWSYQG